MKTTLYYFSATGNCLSIAQKISSKLEDTELVSIPHAMQTTEDVRGEVLGIVCPIYMYNLPHIVADFIRKIAAADYLFLVFAGGGGLGNGDREAEKIVGENHLKLSALFNVPMPSNYTNFGVTPLQKQQKLLKDADKKVEEIARIVRSGSEHRDSRGTSFFKTNIFPGVLYKLGYSRINTLDGSFWTDEHCNGCGICQKICPVQNISIEDQKPVWHHKCQQCYACLQWCPKESIQSGKKTAGVKRYHHPDVSVKEIIQSSSASKS